MDKCLNGTLVTWACCCLCTPECAWCAGCQAAKTWLKWHIFLFLSTYLAAITDILYWLEPEEPPGYGEVVQAGPLGLKRWPWYCTLCAWLAVGACHSCKLSVCFHSVVCIETLTYGCCHTIEGMHAASNARVLGTIHPFGHHCCQLSGHLPPWKARIQHTVHVSVNRLQVMRNDCGV